MPVHKVKGGFQWGHQKVYPTRAAAQRQAAAIYASGYKGGDAQPGGRFVRPGAHGKGSWVGKDAEFKESEHPRDDAGKFGSGGGGAKPKKLTPYQQERADYAANQAAKAAGVQKPAVKSSSSAPSGSGKGPGWELNAERETRLSPEERQAARTDIQNKFCSAISKAIPEGTEVSHKWTQNGGEFRLTSKIRSKTDPSSFASGDVFLDPQGNVFLRHGDIEVTEKGKGLGGAMVNALVAGFKAIGAKSPGSVAIHANSNPDFWDKMRKRHGGIFGDVALDQARDASIQAAGIAFTDPNSNVLWLKRSDDAPDEPGCWDFPGGMIEDGETPEQAARREAEEEISYVPDGELKLLHDDGFYQTFVQHVDGQFQVKLDAEHVAWAWAPLDHPPQPVHPCIAKMIEVMGNKDAHDSALALDRSSVRSYDKDGRLHVQTTPISKATVNEYLGREIPDADKLGLDPERKYKLLRHPDEIKKAVKTFNNLPLLSRHVPVTADSHQPDLVVGSTGTDAEFDHPYLKNSLVAWTRDAIDAIESGEQKELSCAYRYTPDMTPGEYEGEQYDGVMRDIVGNHVALVKAGRAGPDVVVGDSKMTGKWIKNGKQAHDGKENDMTNKTALFVPKGKIMTRQAAAYFGGLTTFLRPMLAQDARIDVSPMLCALVDPKASRDDRIDAITDATAGHLAQDAKVEALGELLDALEDCDEGVDADPAVTDPNSATPFLDDKPNKTMDAAGMKEFLKGKLSDDDYAAACDMMGGEEDGMDADPDGETDEERKAREEKEAMAAKDARRGARDARRGAKDMIPKSAMDAAIKAGMDTVRIAERGIRTALANVEPWVGKLSPSLAMDSETDVYRHAAVTMGIPNAKKLHPEALWPVIQAQVKPGAKSRDGGSTFVALDSQSTALDEAVKLAPGLARIKAA